MRELVAIPEGNVTLLPLDDRLVATAEVIIVVSEPGYETIDGAIIKRRATTTYRFSASVDGLRQLAAECSAAANRATGLEERFKVEVTP